MINKTRGISRNRPTCSVMVHGRRKFPARKLEALTLLMQLPPGQSDRRELSLAYLVTLHESSKLYGAVQIVLVVGRDKFNPENYNQCHLPFYGQDNSFLVSTAPSLKHLVFALCLAIRWMSNLIDCDFTALRIRPTVKLHERKRLLITRWLLVGIQSSRKYQIRLDDRRLSCDAMIDTNVSKKESVSIFKDEESMFLRNDGVCLRVHTT